MPASFEAGPGITAVDTRMYGREQITSAYLVDAFEPTLVETGPATSAGPVTQALADLGVGPKDLAHVVVTHIHLDHSGGAGQIAEHFPGATIWVHPRGARHLADPSRLVASAARLYGGEAGLARMFGSPVPVAEDRLRSVGDGEVLDLGDRRLTMLHTPGHASHHMAIQDGATGAVFTGDAVGVHLPEIAALRPAAPPPEWDMELAISSIERIRTHARGSLLFSHFGPVRGVDDTCAEAVDRIREWGELVRMAMRHTQDLDDIARALAAGTAGELGALNDLDEERLEWAAGYRLNAAGYLRYWQKTQGTQDS